MNDFERFFAIFKPELIMLHFIINYILGIFNKKAWTITHDFERLLAIFDPN